MTEPQVVPWNHQIIVLDRDEFSRKSGYSILGALATFLIFSGYIDLGVSFWQKLCPDDPEEPRDTKHRWDRIFHAEQYARLNPIQPMPLKHSTDKLLYITAHELHTDRTGRQLQRIADFLDGTRHQTLARLIQQQIPVPYPRDITSRTDDPPTWVDHEKPTADIDSPLWNCQLLHAVVAEFASGSRCAAPVALAEVLAFSGYVGLAATLLRYLVPDDPQHPHVGRDRWHCLIWASQLADYQPPEPVTVDPAPPADELYISAYDLYTDRTGEQLERIADFLQQTDFDHLAAIVRQEPPTPIKRKASPPDYMRTA